MSRISRAAYASLYGPTTGDKVRLADTDLIVEVQEDLTHYGDEVTFGSGKVIRDGMGQCQRQADEVMDLVITNALILDFWGVVKADVGIKNGRIRVIGRAGNPDTQFGIDVRIGPATEIIAGEGLLLTAGGIDAQAHLVCPQQVEEALMSGITTLIGGGTGPINGGDATACTPGPWNIRRMLQATEGLPVNIGLLGKGNGSLPNALEEQVRAGAMGLKLHAAWGTTPAALGCALTVADKMDVQVALHADHRNEAGSFADLIAACQGRGVHVCHAGGAEGGHAPEIIEAAGLAHVLPSSTNLSLPYTVNTLDEQAALTRDGDLPSAALPQASSQPGRPAALAAADVLHDLGAFSLLASGSPALGRIGEVITRTWQIAHKMKTQRGHLEPPRFHADIDRGNNDNYRVKRYLAKYTINPAIAYGIAHEVGSIEVGKLADLVLWRPAFFGIKPSLVIKGGMIIAGPVGDPNAALSASQPVHDRPLFAASGMAIGQTCMTFMSQWAFQAGEPQRLALKRLIGVCRDVRQVRKIDMIHNFWQPKIEVDPKTHEVRADGVLLTSEPATEVPLARRYCLF